MPLDGHGHLVKQGWSGKGTGLRHGAIAKPITVVQKKTLAGIGKDRDEAFPFWDHVFQAAAVSIQLKLHKDSDEESNADSDSGSGSQTPALDLKRTTTGIISNRRPLSGTPALSGATTPADSSSSSGTSTPQLSVMAAAKQQAARRMLYASFYRGPVLSSDDLDEGDDPSLASEAGPSTSASSSSEKEVKVRGKKRKAGEEEDKQERKRRKREAKEKEKAEAKKEKRRSKSKKQEMDRDVDNPGGNARHDESEVNAAKALREAEKLARRRAEKRARKEERRRRKAERKGLSHKKANNSDLEDATAGASGAIAMSVDTAADTPEAAPLPSKKERKAKREERVSDVDASSGGKKSKKKAKTS
ncbi:hypothetical protein C8Q79DRAFT_981927 [Trametes meyenii]|nr:hypothetical protein C8Q79DRAFT_981927 [Trametes meyenii]